MTIPLLYNFLLSQLQRTVAIREAIDHELDRIEEVYLWNQLHEDLDAARTLVQSDNHGVQLPVDLECIVDSLDHELQFLDQDLDSFRILDVFD